MVSPPPAQQRRPAGGGPLPSFLRLLASLKLAVVLLLILAAVLIGATFLESRQGTERALWYIYRADWFVALWGMLGVNVLAAMLMRFPWKRRHVGFVVAHVGVLVLLTGACVTWRWGIEGRISFMEGETIDSIGIYDRSQITIEQGQELTRLALRNRPDDWPPGKTLDFGTSEGLGVKVLKFYRHATKRADWVADESGRGGPALKLDLAGPGGNSMAQSWLPQSQLAATQTAIPAALHEVADAAMLEDLRQPPGDPEAKDGVLSMYFEGQVYRVPVHEKVGQKVPVGQSGIEVEIVKYFPNAKVGPKVQFSSEGDEPKNPLLDLLVHLPDQQQPVRQLAFANYPFLNLDGVHGERCPIRFLYLHPAASSQSGAEFLHTPDGKLYCRVAEAGKHRWQGEVREGQQIEIGGNLGLSILEYIPHARPDTGFVPVPAAADEGQMTEEAAALIEVTVAGEKPQEIWLERSDQRHGLQSPEVQRIQTAKGPLSASFGYEHIPLGFSLKLLDFKRGMNPGRKGDASFASSVQLIDSAKGIDQPREISMNQPLEYGKFTFYQSSFKQLPDGREASFLTAAYDPGRILKYSGSLLICLGTFVIFYLRGRRSAKSPTNDRSA